MSLDPVKHRIILINILKDIFTNSLVGPVLGFKGGTAAYLFYGLDRFSVDLDFDLSDSSKEEVVFEEIKKILQKYGRVKTADKKKYSFTYILDYDERDLGAQNVKVEINRRDFGSRFTVKSYLGISMRVMIPEDMVANKMVAMYERMGKTNRDIYDTWFFFSKDWDINTDLVEKRTGMPYKEFLKACIVQLEQTDGRRMLTGMGEVLDAEQKVWVKTKLRDELLFQLKLHLQV